LEREMSATSKRDRAIRDGVEPVMSSAKGLEVIGDLEPAEPKPGLQPPMDEVMDAALPEEPADES
jgi:hypothetical protein